MKALACLLLCAASSLAPAADFAERYRIDPSHTFAVFEYSHWGLSRQQGRFDKASGSIELSPAEGRGQLDITLETGAINTGLEAFNATLRSEEFFDAQQFPQIGFRSTNMQFDKGRLQYVDGLLSIKGITRPTRLEVTHFDCRFMLIYARRACGANATAKLLRSEFGLGRYVPFVSDEVTLSIAVEAIQEQAAAQPE